jgi:hypothetical protein
VESQYDSCVLIVGGRVVVRADAGPLEAELALFSSDCIELKTTDPGAVREAGYRTTASEARARLADLGITQELAERTARAMIPNLATAYARGPVVRRAVAELGPSEMFEGHIYLTSAKAYEGQWLDLAALTFDLGDQNVARALQAMYLAAILAELPEDADVFLSTLALTQNQRPGVRTLKRVSFGNADEWPSRMKAFGEDHAPRSARDGGPTRVEVLDWLQAIAERGVMSAKARADRIERAIATTPRPPPNRGPLSDPVAWSIEAQLDAGEASAALARIDMMERDRGSNPCVMYLRARASLMLNREDPQVIAERVSMLASSASFDELELLAAQAWAAAGNAGRALPYARVLAANPRAPEELRSRARKLVEQVESARPPSQFGRGPSGKRTTGGIVSEPLPIPISEPPQQIEQEASGVIRRATPLPAVLAVGNFATAATAHPSAPPTPRAQSNVPVRRKSTARSHHAEEMRDQRQIATLPPPENISGLQTPELDDPATPPPEGPHEVGHAPKDERTLVKGISRPAFRAVSTNSTPPRLSLGKLELAETFDDPPSPPSMADTRVRSAHEARLQCTAMARELGMLYRTQHGIELRNDLGSLEVIQAELIARYNETGVRTVAAMLDLRRHGAFLSEMIARTLKATWLDVGPKELGHWTMFVPPDTRVWPFARVLRFVTMGSKERDLVAYFLELHARSY